MTTRSVSSRRISVYNTRNEGMASLAPVMDFDALTSPTIYRRGYYWVCKMDVEEGCLRTEYGKVGTQKPTHKQRKVVPKAKRTMKEQCEQELTQRYKEQIQDGYSRENTVTGNTATTPTSTSNSTVVHAALPSTQKEENNEEEVTDLSPSVSALAITPQKMKLPMLAQKYHERITKKNGIVYPLAVQKKANGVRGLFAYSESGTLIYSRTLHSYYFMQELRDDVYKILKIRPDIVLDGELYAHGVAGQNITSMCVQKSTPHKDEYLLRLWLFDCYITTAPEMPFFERHALLVDLCKQARCEKVVLMDTTIVQNDEEMQALHKKHKDEGWEGTMLRHNKPYSHRRSNDLIKYKFAEEMDTIILGVEETEGGDINLLLKMENGKQFKHRPEGTVAEKVEWMVYPKLVIGKVYSFHYTHLSEDGIPLSIHWGCIRFDDM